MRLRWGVWTLHRNLGPSVRQSLSIVARYMQSATSPSQRKSPYTVAPGAYCNGAPEEALRAWHMEAPLNPQSFNTNLLNLIECFASGTRATLHSNRRLETKEACGLTIADPADVREAKEIRI